MDFPTSPSKQDTDGGRDQHHHLGAEDCDHQMRMRNFMRICKTKRGMGDLLFKHYLYIYISFVYNIITCIICLSVVT